MVQIFWSTLGLKPGAWTTSVFMIEMMLMTMLLTVPDPPTHSKLEAAHCSLTFLANHQAQCSAQHSVAHQCCPLCCTVLPTQHSQSSENSFPSQSPATFQNHNIGFKVATSRLPLNQVRQSQFLLGPSGFNSPRTRLTLKILCVFPQQVFPICF